MQGGGDCGGGGGGGGGGSVLLRLAFLVVAADPLTDDANSDATRAAAAAAAWRSFFFFFFFCCNESVAIVVVSSKQRSQRAETERLAWRKHNQFPKETKAIAQIQNSKTHQSQKKLAMSIPTLSPGTSTLLGTLANLLIFIIISTTLAASTHVCRIVFFCLP
jgi:hypothetical protein